MSAGRGVGLADRGDAARIALALRGGAKRSHTAKKAGAGLSAEQRAEIDVALGAYGACLTDDDRSAKGDKVMVGGGNVLASYPAARAGQSVSDFVEKFWFWKKGTMPAAGHARKKSPAQLDREIAESLARRSHATAGNPFDVQIGDAVQFRWEPP